MIKRVYGSSHLGVGRGIRKAEMGEQYFVRCMNPQGFHDMAYYAWGEPDNTRVLVCVHGLTRNGRDFDTLARALSHDFRVICPDVAGRGASDWLPDPAFYNVGQYAADMVNLLAHLHVPCVDWLGTSMGGLIGMMLASKPGTPIQRLILNDVGPHIPSAALRRIAEYVGDDLTFSDIHAVSQYLQTIHASFGALTEAQWLTLARHSVRTSADGALHLHYDPAIGTAFRETPLLLDVDLWEQYEAIHCPTLVLRGAQSDLLTAASAEKMQQRGPQARVEEIAHTGHAPHLMSGAQIALIEEFLFE